MNQKSFAWIWTSHLPHIPLMHDWKYSPICGALYYNLDGYMFVVDVKHPKKNYLHDFCLEIYIQANQ